MFFQKIRRNFILRCLKKGGEGAPDGAPGELGADWGWGVVGPPAVGGAEIDVYVASGWVGAEAAPGVWCAWEEQVSESVGGVAFDVEVDG